jgi:hypothetical protein
MGSKGNEIAENKRRQLFLEGEQVQLNRHEQDIKKAEKINGIPCDFHSMPKIFLMINNRKC